MIFKTLYRYERPDGGITDTLDKPEYEYTERVRIIADEGKAITKDGENLYIVLDVDSAEGFYEIDLPVEPEETVTEATEQE